MTLYFVFLIGNKLPHIVNNFNSEGNVLLTSISVVVSSIDENTRQPEKKNKFWIFNWCIACAHGNSDSFTAMVNQKTVDLALM